MSTSTAPLTDEADASGTASVSTPDPADPADTTTSDAADTTTNDAADGAADQAADETAADGEASPPADDDPPPVISLDPAAGIDAGMLAQLADAGADLSQARRIAHFLYVPDEASATAVVADLDDTFTAVVWTPTDTQPEWTVVAEVRDAAVTAESIAADDTAFSALAETHGGRYDGWEATV